MTEKTKAAKARKSEKKSGEVPAKAPGRSWDNLIVPQFANVEDLRKLAPAAIAPLPPVLLNRVTLKKFEYFAALSQETTAFAAQVCFDGELVAYAQNSGLGGGTSIHLVPESRVLESFKSWLKALPPMSSYQRLYENMLSIQESSGVYAAGDSRDLPDRYWFYCQAVDMESVVDHLVEARVFRKQFRGLNKLVVVGSDTRGGDYKTPVILRCGIPVDYGKLAGLRARYGWADLLEEFLLLPPHYYPAPHNFAVANFGPRARVRHLASGRVGLVQYKTNDHEVHVQFEGSDSNTVHAPEELAFDRETE